jgi:hypothetical protein
LKVLALVVALLSATFLVACGGAHVASGGPVLPVLHIAVSPFGITVDGQSVSVAQLDARLADLQKQGGRVWLLSGGGPTATPSPSALLSKKELEKAKLFEQQVIALVGAHHLRIVSSNMPVMGSVSPNASPHSDP